MKRVILIVVLLINALMVIACDSASPASPGNDNDAITNSENGNRESSSEFEFPMHFKTDEIIEFEMIEGQEGWIAGARQGFQDAIWTFESDGTFSYTRGNGDTNLYPLTGRFDLSGNILTFSGNGESRVGNTGLTLAEVQGRVDLAAVPPQLSMKAITSASASANINETEFGYSTQSEYDINVTLKFNR